MSVDMLHTCKCIFICIIVAVRRCYENVRRTFLEHQSGKEDVIEEQAKRRKYRSRRDRVNLSIIMYTIVAACTCMYVVIYARSPCHEYCLIMPIKVVKYPR